jgi:hypothetical protein
VLQHAQRANPGHRHDGQQASEPDNKRRAAAKTVPHVFQTTRECTVVSDTTVSPVEKYRFPGSDLDSPCIYIRGDTAMFFRHGRYDNQLSDIVVLTQAQLSLTEAEIANLNAKCDYQSQYSLLQYTFGLLR